MVEVPKAEHKESPSETPPIIIKIGGNTLRRDYYYGGIATLHGNGDRLLLCMEADTQLIINYERER